MSKYKIIHEPWYPYDPPTDVDCECGAFQCDSTVVIEGQTHRCRKIHIFNRAPIHRCMCNETWSNSEAMVEFVSGAQEEESDSCRRATDQAIESDLSPEVVAVFKDKTGDWRWQRRARNGQVIATSGEGYTEKRECVEMAARLNPNARLHVPRDT